MDSPRLQANIFPLPFHEMASDLYFFSLDFTDGNGAHELAMQVAADATLWHRRLGRLNRKSLGFLRKQDGNVVSFDGTAPDCNFCATGRGTYGLTTRRPIV